MILWEFKKYENTELKENENNLRTWFYKCKCKDDYRMLFAFLYGIEPNEILDCEVDNLLGDIKNYGFQAFLNQYYNFKHLGFSSRVILFTR